MHRVWIGGSWRSAAATAVAMVLAGCGLGGAEQPSASPGVATVQHVVDGDTIVVEVAGARESVRLIGIDTPESVAQDRPVECFGPEASDRLKELLPPRTEVRLERDVEARDRYNRLLAYVTRSHDGTFVNLLLVEEGYAEAVRFPPNLAHQAELDGAQSAARAAGRGLWSSCG